MLVDNFRLFSMSNIILTPVDRIKNIKGTYACEPRKKITWKLYWMMETGRKWPKTCRIYGCGKPAIGGGHVRVSGHSTKVFIIPMCSACNSPMKTAWMYANAHTKAAHVQSKDTRGPVGPCYRH